MIVWSNGTSFGQNLAEHVLWVLRLDTLQVNVVGTITGELLLGLGM